MGPDQVAARLDDRFGLLTGGSRIAMPRHQTLRAVVDWSWDLLDEAERTVWRRFAISRAARPFRRPSMSAPPLLARGSPRSPGSCARIPHSTWAAGTPRTLVRLAHLTRGNRQSCHPVGDTRMATASLRPEHGGNRCLGCPPARHDGGQDGQGQHGYGDDSYCHHRDGWLGHDIELA